jgi:hypothetical protein
VVIEAFVPLEVSPTIWGIACLHSIRTKINIKYKFVLFQICSHIVVFLKKHITPKVLALVFIVLILCCRRPARLTWSVFLRIPICAPSMPSVSPSCPKTSSWPEESVVNVHKRESGYTIDCINTNYRCHS